MSSNPIHISYHPLSQRQEDVSYIFANEFLPEPVQIPKNVLANLIEMGENFPRPLNLTPVLFAGMTSVAM
jgi:hypothetical protein